MMGDVVRNSVKGGAFTFERVIEKKLSLEQKATLISFMVYQFEPTNLEINKVKDVYTVPVDIVAEYQDIV